MFPFPRDKEKCRIWSKATNYPWYKTTNERPRVCRRHFKEEDILYGSFITDKNGRQFLKLRLKATAVPSRNLEVIRSSTDRPRKIPELTLDEDLGRYLKDFYLYNVCFFHYYEHLSFSL